MKVITFSKVFPVYHPRRGEPTEFVGKILSGEKKHTIRAGNRWKVGERVSARTWTDKPYRSKQSEFAELVLEKIWDILLKNDGSIYVNGKYLGPKTLDSRIYSLAKNDGLGILDLCYWFNKPFSGQILCWDENVNY